MANRIVEKNEFWIISDTKILYGPARWNGKIVEAARKFREIFPNSRIMIVKVLVDETIL